MSYETLSGDACICPHCGHRHYAHDDNYELYDEETTEWECINCEKMFKVSVYVSYAWETNKIEVQDCDD